MNAKQLLGWFGLGSKAPELRALTPRQTLAVAVLCGLTFAALQSLGSALQVPTPQGHDVAALGPIDFSTTWQPKVRQRVLGHWQANGSMAFIATSHLLIDALLLVPLYAVLLVSLGRMMLPLPSAMPNTAAAGRLGGMATPRWVGVPVLAAASADQLENITSLAFIHGWVPAYSGAAHAGLAAMAAVKWLSLGAAAIGLVGLVVALAKSMGRAQCFDKCVDVAHVATDVVKYVFLNAYAFLAIGAGIALVGFVGQSRDILHTLGFELNAERTATLLRAGHLQMLGIATVVLGVAIWLCMRVVVRWAPAFVRPASADVNRFVAHAPQVVAFFAVVALAMLCTLYMSARASLPMAVFMGLGALIILETVTASLSRLANRFEGTFVGGHKSEGNAYRQEGAVAVLAAFVVAWFSLGDGLGPVLQAFGWSRDPLGVWHWRPEGVSAPTRVLLLMFAVAAAAHWGRLRFEGTGFSRALLNVLALQCWLIGAALAEATLAVLTFGVVLLVSSVLVWVAAEAPHINWRQLAAVRDKLLEALPKVLSAVRLDLLLIGLALAYAILLIVLFSKAPLSGAGLGTLAIALLAFSVWGLTLTLVAIYLPMRAGVGNWCAVPLVWLVLFGQASERDLRSSEVPAGQTVALPAIAAYFERWREGLPDRKESPVFFVAAAGGGLRAAYWTATLMASMDDRTCGQFGRHVFAVSGVSGGSLGLTAYLAQRKVWSAKPVSEQCKPGRVAEMKRFLAQDYLSPLAGSLLFAEAAQAFVPFPYLQNNRATTLADALAARWQDAIAQTTWTDPQAATKAKLLLEQPFLDVFSTQPAEGSLPPAVYINATGVESGRRIIASNVWLGSMQADALFQADAISGSLRLNTHGLSVIDAAVNSARFPGVTPPGRVTGCTPTILPGAVDAGACDAKRSRVWGHVVDGGFFENSGLETLMDAWRELRTQPDGLPRSGLPPMFVIAINNDRQAQPLCAAPTPRIDMVSRDRSTVPTITALAAIARSAFRQPAALQEGPGNGSDLAGPVAALLQVREGRTDLELRRLVETLGCPYVLEWHLGPELREQGAEPPLGWMLASRSVAAMDRAVGVYSNFLPFDAQWCQRNTRPPRGYLGKWDATVAPPSCPAVPIPPGPLRPGAR